MGGGGWVGGECFAFISDTLLEELSFSALLLREGGKQNNNCDLS